MGKHKVHEEDTKNTKEHEEHEEKARRIPTPPRLNPPPMGLTLLMSCLRALVEPHGAAAR
jgi:hypothetical protein